MTCYTDTGYESFPIADLDLDLHRIQLPNSVLAARRQTKLLALERERLAALPKDHKVFLVPADPRYSSTEDDLWPLVTPPRAPRLAQPIPANFEMPSTQNEKIISRNEPGDLVQNNHFGPRVPRVPGNSHITW